MIVYDDEEIDVQRKYDNCEVSNNKDIEEPLDYNNITKANNQTSKIVYQNNFKQKQEKYQAIEYNSKIIISVVQVKSNIGISILHSENIVSSLNIEIKDLESYFFFLFQNLKPNEIHYSTSLQTKATLERIISYNEKNTNDIMLKQYSKIKFSYQNLNLYFKNYFNLIYPLNNDVQINIKIVSILDNLTHESHLALFSLLKLILPYYLEHRDSLILEFNKLKYDDYVRLSYNINNDLNIFEEKLHPSLIKGFGKAKEGFSIFSLFLKNITTSQGKTLLKQYFSYPLKSKKVINQRLDCIEDLGKVYLEKGIHVFKQIKLFLRKSKDFNKLIFELNKFKFNNLLLWNSLRNSLVAGIDLIKLFLANFCNNKLENTSFTILNKYLEDISLEKLDQIINFIDTCIGQTPDGITYIKEGVNEDLDIIKQDYNILNDILSKTAKKHFQEYRTNSFLDKVKFIFLPQFGYLISLEKEINYLEFLYTIKAYWASIENNKEYVVKGVKLRFDKETDQVYEEINEINYYDGANGYNKNEIMFSNSQFSLNNSNTKNKYKTNNLNDIENYQNNNDRIINLPSVNVLENEDNIANYEETAFLQRIIFSDFPQEANFRFQFHSEMNIYFKNTLTDELDKLYGDLAARIVDTESAIYREIATQILDYSDLFLHLNEFISHIDVFICLFETSLVLNLSRPLINDSESNDCQLIIKEGKNLIMDLISTQYNTFSIAIKGGVAILFGSSYSGKSTLLKAIGQIVYLSQIGCFVPCDYMEFQIFDQILTGINISESIMTSLSGFSKELSSINYINSLIIDDNEVDIKPTSCSLVLLDDPYTRTSEINKFSLLFGGIDKYNNLFRNNPSTCIIITTTSNMIDLAIDQNLIHKLFINTILIHTNEKYQLNCINDLVFESAKNNEVFSVDKEIEIISLVCKELIGSKQLLFKQCLNLGLSDELLLSGKKYLKLLENDPDNFDINFLNSTKINETINNIQDIKEKIINNLNIDVVDLFYKKFSS